MKPKYEGQISRTEGGIVYIMDMSHVRKNVIGALLGNGFRDHELWTAMMAGRRPEQTIAIICIRSNRALGSMAVATSYRGGQQNV